LNDFWAGTRLIDGVIAFTLLEGVALAVYHRRTGCGVGVGEFGANMVAGVCLMLALRLAVGAAGGSAWVALCLLAAGVAHGVDIWRRWGRTLQ